MTDNRQTLPTRFAIWKPGFRHMWRACLALSVPRALCYFLRAGPAWLTLLRRHGPGVMSTLSALREGGKLENHCSACCVGAYPSCRPQILHSPSRTRALDRRQVLSDAGLQKSS